MANPTRRRSPLCTLSANALGPPAWRGFGIGGLAAPVTPASRVESGGDGHGRFGPVGRQPSSPPTCCLLPGPFCFGFRARARPTWDVKDLVLFVLARTESWISWSLRLLCLWCWFHLRVRSLGKVACSWLALSDFRETYPASSLFLLVQCSWLYACIAFLVAAVLALCWSAFVCDLRSHVACKGVLQLGQPTRSPGCHRGAGPLQRQRALGQ